MDFWSATSRSPGVDQGSAWLRVTPTPGHALRRLYGVKPCAIGGGLPSIRRPDRNLIDGFEDTRRDMGRLCDYGKASRW